MVLRDKIMVLRLWVTLKSSSESEKNIRLSGLAIFTVYHINNPIYCSQGRSHVLAWGAWPCKKKNFH